MAANVYVDGPNLYYSALKDAPWRWLDLPRWCDELLPGLEVQRVRYFTAWANPGNGLTTSQGRQSVYLRALATSPRVTLHFGRCLTDAARLRAVENINQTHQVVKVRQKGVDVSLATHLLRDAATGDCDTAVVVSSDSDLRTPIEAVRESFRVRVGLINPRKGTLGLAMRESVDFHVRPPKESYPSAQFPVNMTDRHGRLHAPKGWVPTQ